VFNLLGPLVVGAAVADTIGGIVTLGLVGAGLLQGGADAIRWGGVDGIHPVGVVGTLIALAVSPVLGALAALVVIRGARAAGRRTTRRRQAPVWAGQ
jgi:hypothetical protein